MPPGCRYPRILDDKYQNQDAAAVHQASHSTPEHSLTLPEPIASRLPCEQHSTP
jgi:hypothetical protein